VLVRSTAAGRDAYLAPLIAQMRAELPAAGLRVRVEARDRHLYSVYRDLPRGVDGTLHPRSATRIVVVADGPDTDCYVALGALHARWRPVQSRFKDYVATPKHNMYRSLHTSLLADDGETIDVIIRTPAMDQVASFGVAAHIRAAGGRTGRVSTEAARLADLKWMDRLLAWQPLTASEDFLASLRADLDTGGILVFAPDGTPIGLPAGATGVDFAYVTAPETANRAVGVLVNGRRTALERQLAHGQVVQLITGPPADPPRSWLESARSAQARAHLQRWFANKAAEIARHAVEQAAASGRQALAAALTSSGAHLLDLEASGMALRECRRLGYADLDDLYAAIGKGKLALDDLLTALIPRCA
jgi:GTP pyrophosphokinase